MCNQKGKTAQYSKRNVKIFLINYPFFLFPERTVVGPATKSMIEEGRYTFCLSFPAIGESSRSGATYPQYHGYPNIAASDQPGQAFLTSAFLNFDQDASLSATLHPFSMELCPMICVENAAIKSS
jgi:hypothetical protein